MNSESCHIGSKKSAVLSHGYNDGAYISDGVNIAGLIRKKNCEGEGSLKNAYELAKKCGVSRQTISAIEKGDYNPTINLCIQICKVLGKTLDELFWEEEP